MTMNPESENTHLINPVSTAELVSPAQKTRATMSLESQERFESDMESPYSQDIASSPNFGDSDDSVPALNLSGSPSPTSRRVSIGDSVPATPTSHLIESARVDNDSDTSSRYHRIHSTPYPKPRLPLQLTPHPQARVVSLPEWTRNRDPFLEAMRNLRSVSSPARFKRPPLSPLCGEETSFEVSGSSQSVASSISFPALPEQESVRRSILSEQISSLSVSREQFYTAPEGFFLTPPSFKSITLSPITTGPERSLPQDRYLPSIREDDSTCSVEPNSEDEVSLMLQRATLDTSSHYNRSSVSFSNTSRSSSPESVVFLSSIPRVSRSFLGGKAESIPEASSTQGPVYDPAHGPAVHTDGNISQERQCAETHVERHESEPSGQYAAVVQEEPKMIVNKDEASDISIIPSSRGTMRREPDWIFFDPPRPIPALHGPPSLPYARCPSGAEGVVLDDQQELDGVVWGLSEKDPRSHRLDEHGRIETPNAGQFLFATENIRPPCKATRDSRKAEPNVTPSVPEAQQLTAGHTSRPLSTISEDALTSSPNSKEKHVRFVDSTNEDQLAPKGYRASAPSLTPASTSEISELKPPADLTKILLDQVEKAREMPKPLHPSVAPASRKEILDQLRRFGVPFRPYGLPTPPSTVSPQFVSQFPSSDLLLAPGRLVQHGNPRPLTITPEPSIPKTFAQAAMQDRAATVLLKPPQDSDILTRATGLVPPSLSNIKSIPLLRLQQRQRAGMDPWRKDEQPLGEVVPSAHGVRTEAVRDVNESSASIVKTSQPNSTLCQVDSASAIASVAENTVPTDTGGLSSLNRRQRRSNKRAPQEAPSAKSEPPSKENHQAAGSKINSDSNRKSSRQTGRKKNQRTRTDSLPQNASRT
ncbi:unnamed protein product [Rhizoctonia solani]|uniref:Uncharacterized protein n=1 Tax=Rhizoctonia solani TaxID=456999 RepID=A0A8H3GGV8_9AGAM|nr:unnamed protein product [Rhizoctonia solani]CAE6449090.1 unnamed protein product [Rhizoctonia solani]